VIGGGERAHAGLQGMLRAMTATGGNDDPDVPGVQVYACRHLPRRPCVGLSLAASGFPSR
jgi:hypothetical protein